MQSFVKNFMEFSYSLVVYMAIPFLLKTFFEKIPSWHIWKICIANSVIGFFYFVFDASIRGGVSSIEAAIGWGIVSYIYLKGSYKEMFGHQKAHLEELEQRLFNSNRENSVLKAEIQDLNQEIRQSLSTVNQLNQEIAVLNKDILYGNGRPHSEIVIDYRSKFFTNDDYIQKAKLYSKTASEFWVVDIPHKKTFVYTLGEEITVREVPFGWKINEDSLYGYCQIFIYGLTNSEHDALEDHPVP